MCSGWTGRARGISTAARRPVAPISPSRSRCAEIMCDTNRETCWPSIPRGTGVWSAHKTLTRRAWRASIRPNQAFSPPRTRWTTPGSPAKFRWHGGVETPAFFATMDADSLGPEVDPEAQRQIRYKPEETPVTLAAKKTSLGRVYLSWAEYPVVETEQLQNDPADNPVESARAAYVVRFRDLREGYPGRSGRATLGAMVFLTRDLQVVEERFGIRGNGTKTR